MRTRRSWRNQDRLWRAIGADLAAASHPPVREEGAATRLPRIRSRREQLDDVRQARLEAARAAVRAVLVRERDKQ